MSRILSMSFLMVAAVALTACKTPEERAAEYFASAQSLLEQGDEERALVELRNVFQNDNRHLEARQTYADLLLERGDTGGAYSQYLRLIEQYPDTVDVRLVLSELSLATGNWDAVERHGRAAIELAPDNPRSRALAMALDYREAALARDSAVKDDMAAEVLQEIFEQPDNLVLRRVIIDYYRAAERAADAQPHVEAALAIAPKDFDLNYTKLQILAALNDEAAVGVQLKGMMTLFPENEEIKTSLMRWFSLREDLDGAETFLRGETGEDTGPTQPHMNVVQFLLSARGREAGRAELQRLADANSGTPNGATYIAALAAMTFEEGKVEESIAALEEVLKDAEASDETRRIMALQARMYDRISDAEKAEALVATVLEQDPTNVDALKLRARWGIQDDRPGDAIVDLRTAQSQAPRDPEIMTLLAGAFERDGSVEQTGEQLSLAVEASNNRADESIRYANFLRGRGRAGVAETVLTNARTVAPNNPQVLVALAQVQLELEKWTQVNEIADLLAKSENPDFQRTSQQIKAAILMAQNQVDDGLELLNTQAAAAAEANDLPSIVTLVTAQINNGQFQEARDVLDQRMAELPPNLTLRLLSANVDAQLGNFEQAETELRALITENPGADVPTRMLYGVLRGTDRQAEADALLDEALIRIPASRELLWIKAGNLERANAFDGAIEIYERIYALDSSDVIAANNLASMLSVHRDDEESLERAYNVARRLRAQEAPAFQDTYGWIEYRRGNPAAALPYLEASAAGLPNEPLAQFHLAMTYADLGRTQEAVIRFERMLELDPDRTLPQSAEAERRLEELAAAE